MTNSTYLGLEESNVSLDEFAGAIARALDRDGVGETVVAAVASRFRLAALVAASLGTSRRVVFPHGYSSSVLDALATESGGRIVHDREGARGLDLRGLPVDDGGSIPLAAALHDATDREALVFMTSGTTGSPKASTKTVAQVLDEARTLADSFGIVDGDVIALGVPSTHLFGFLFGIALPSVRSLRVHSELVRSAIGLAPRPRWFIGAPPTIRSFVEGGAAPDGLGIIVSGAALDASLDAAARNAGASRVIEIFGSTETGGIGFREAPGAPFRVFPGVELIEQGERVDVTSPFTRSRPVTITDRLTIEGSAFRFVERDADVVKVGGRRISIGAVEASLRSLGGVSDVVVRARVAPGGRGSRLAALVVSERSSEDLRRALGAELDPEFVPRPLVRVPSIARSPSGKLPFASFEGQLESGLRTARSGLEVRADGNVFEVRVDASVRRFEGHFPAHPILPGVSVLLDLVMPMVHARFSELAWPRRLTRVKFMRPIRPSDVLRCELVRTGPERITFELNLIDGTKVGSGNLDFGATSDAPRSHA